MVWYYIWYMIMKWKPNWTNRKNAQPQIQTFSLKKLNVCFQKIHPKDFKSSFVIC